MDDILKKVQDGTLSLDKAKELIAEKERKPYLKITPKGCVGIYGIRRMPISLYKEELEKVLELLTSSYEPSQVFEEFLEENKRSLK